MNVVDGTLRRDGGAGLGRGEGGVRWPVAAERAGPRTARRCLRRAPRRPRRSARGADARSVPAEVIVVEPTGAETELLVQVGAAQLVVVMHGRTAGPAGRDDRAWRSTPARVHLFDPTSGVALAG